MMVGIENAAIKGAQAGAIIGVHKALGCLTGDAMLMLRDEAYKTAKTPKQEGTRAALLKLGYIKRHWFFWWKVTEKGKQYLGATA